MGRAGFLGHGGGRRLEGLGGSLLSPPALRALQRNLWKSDTWACFPVHRAISLPWPRAIFMGPSLLFLLMENQAQKGEGFPMVAQLGVVDSGLSGGPQGWVLHLADPSPTKRRGSLGPEEGAHKRRRECFKELPVSSPSWSG